MTLKELAELPKEKEERAMQKMSAALTCSALFVGFIIFSAIAAGESDSAKTGGAPLVGAIRWDGWFEGNHWEKRLVSQKWRHRLPFYARVVSKDDVQVCSDSQEVMDQEIAYGSRAGLSYWAFDYYHPKAWLGADRYNYGLRRYLASKRKAKLNFCLIIFPMAQHLGPVEAWPRTVATLVRFFKAPTYQKVLDGRPLLYAYQVQQMAKYFGSHKAARNALETLRSETVKAGLGPPYIVPQVFYAATGAKYVDALGFDALSAYTIFDFKGGNHQYPYSVLAKANRDFWDACKATGKKVIPIVNVGWDNRPLRGDKAYNVGNSNGPWYAEPTPREIEDHLRSACQWNRENPQTAEVNAVLIYAWNETAEGGWLHPTRSEGTARLDAIRRALTPEKP